MDYNNLGHGIISGLWLMREKYGLYACAITPFTGLSWWTTDDKKTSERTRHFLMATTGVCAAFGPASLWWLDEKLGATTTLPVSQVTPLTVGLTMAAGAAAWVGWNRKGAAAWEVVKARFLKKTGNERETKTDIRTVEEQLRSYIGKSYDPEKYFKPGFFFLGLDENRKPIYLEYPRFGKHRHTQASGTTGVGKGVACGIYGAQCVRHGEAVIIFDPKDDEYAPHLYRQEAEKAGRPFAYIDLRKRVAQVDILAGCSPDEAHMLLVAGFAYAAGGTDADYHKRRGRVLARKLLDRVYASNPCPTLWDLWQVAAADPEMVKEAQGFVDAMDEAASGTQLSAGKGGLDLVGAIEEGAIVYIQGSTAADVAVLQRMLLVRVSQICAARDRISSTPRQVMVFLDEVKVLLSQQILDDLAMARDKGMHLVIAHQSLGDFRQAPGLDPDAIKNAIVENCRQRFLYGIGDSDTGEWLAGNSGDILIDDEAKTYDANGALVEQATGSRTLRVGDRARVDKNMWLGMGEVPGLAVLVAGGFRFVHLCPMKVEKKPLRLTHVGQLPGGPGKSYDPASGKKKDLPDVNL